MTQQGDDEIDCRRNDIPVKGFLSAGGDAFGLQHQIVDADQAHQRGVLQQHQPLVTEAGQGMAPHLRHHQTEEYGRFRQPQRLAGLPLALRNRFQRAAQRLRGVSGIQQRQGDRPAEERADVKVLNLHLHRDLREPERDGETVRERQQQLGRAEIDKQHHQNFR